MPGKVAIGFEAFFSKDSDKKYQNIVTTITGIKYFKLIQAINEVTVVSDSNVCIAITCSNQV